MARKVRTCYCGGTKREWRWHSVNGCGVNKDAAISAGAHGHEENIPLPPLKKARKKMDVHFSSETGEWGTPQDFYDGLNARFNFTLDPCATKENAKCKRFFTKEDDGLKQSWAGEIVFMNPPYGREQVFWIEKAHIEAAAHGATVVALLPARTDTRVFHTFILGGGHEVHFVKGRLRFEGASGPAPFPSMVVTFRPRVTRHA